MISFFPVPSAITQPSQSGSRGSFEVTPFDGHGGAVQRVNHLPDSDLCGLTGQEICLVQCESVELHQTVDDVDIGGPDTVRNRDAGKSCDRSYEFGSVDLGKRDVLAVGLSDSFQPYCHVSLALDRRTGDLTVALDRMSVTE